MLENGADIRFIQQPLGHARLDTTQIYTEVDIKSLRAVYAHTHPAAKQGGTESRDNPPESCWPHTMTSVLEIEEAIKHTRPQSASRPAQFWGLQTTDRTRSVRLRQKSPDAVSWRQSYRTEEQIEVSHIERTFFLNPLATRFTFMLVGLPIRPSEGYLLRGKGGRS